MTENYRKGMRWQVRKLTLDREDLSKELTLMLRSQDKCKPDRKWKEHFKWREQHT